MDAIHRRKARREATKAYCSRAQALKKLGCTLPDFRKLCILKGVYPRVPEYKRAERDKLYYHVRDVSRLSRDSLLAQLHQERIKRKRSAKALARGDRVRARRLAEEARLASTLDLAPVIAERYPSFVEALRDMDDALTLLSVFAVFPTRSAELIDKETVVDCRRLVDEWLLFTAETGALSRCYASIKGMYYEATILNQKIVWLMPHEFSVASVDDVDFKVVGNFLQLYRQLTRFVLFKLYALGGFEYPPQHRSDPELAAARFLTLRLNKVGAATQFVPGGDDDEAPTPLVDLSADASRRRVLFSKAVFFLSRETPVFHLAFVLRAGGAEAVGLELAVDSAEVSQIALEDPAVTHHVVDRTNAAFDALKKRLPAEVIPTRSFIQPQWVLDSFNHCALLPMNPYAACVICPPHLSPFGDSTGHIPEQQRIIENWAARHAPAAGPAAQPAAEPEEEPAAEPEAQPAADAYLGHADDSEPAAVAAAPAAAVYTPTSTLDIDRARMMLSRKKRRLYMKLRDQENATARVRSRLAEKAAAAASSAAASSAAE